MSSRHPSPHPDSAASCISPEVPPSSPEARHKLGWLFPAGPFCVCFAFLCEWHCRTLEFLDFLEKLGGLAKLGFVPQVGWMPQSLPRPFVLQLARFLGVVTDEPELGLCACLTVHLSGSGGEESHRRLLGLRWNLQLGSSLLWWWEQQQQPPPGSVGRWEVRRGDLRT